MPLQTHSIREFPLNTIKRLNNKHKRDYQNETPLPSECKKFIADPKKDYNYVDTQGYKKCIYTCKHGVKAVKHHKCTYNNGNPCNDNNNCQIKHCVKIHCTNKNTKMQVE